MKISKSFWLFVGLTISISGLPAVTYGKSMDCAECRQSAKAGADCRSACEFSVTGKPAQELFSAMQGVESGRCKGSTCVTNLTNLDCHWSNSSDSKSASCRFEGSDGNTQTIDGPKARRLGLAVVAKYRWEPSCGMGSCGFHEALQVKCMENRQKSGKKVDHDCTVEVMEAKVKSSGSKRKNGDQIEHREANPPAN